MSMIKRAALFILAIIAYLPLASLFSSDAYAYAYKANHVSFNPTTKELSLDIEGTLPWSGTQSVYFALDSGAAVNWSHTIAGETVSTDCSNWTHCDVTIDAYSDHTYDPDAETVIYMWTEPTGGQFSQPFTFWAHASHKWTPFEQVIVKDSVVAGIRAQTGENRRMGKKKNK